MDRRFYNKAFDALTLTELYDLMHLRQEVFIVEQNCPYQDADNMDQVSEHILAYDNDNKGLIACARIVPRILPDKKYVSIGRVISKGAHRGTGLGKKLMQYAIKVCKDLHPKEHIKISAQVYALGFYSNLGFVATGPEYLEDDIPHRAMILEV